LPRITPSTDASIPGLLLSVNPRELRPWRVMAWGVFASKLAQFGASSALAIVGCRTAQKRHFRI
jgi:hypothetical protein